MQKQEIYLDNSATTRVCDEAAKRVLFAMTEEYGNAASLHSKGYRAEQLVAEAKKELSGVLSCLEKELLFTSGATEANNLAVVGTALAGKRRGNKIVTTSVEHASVSACMDYLRTLGYEIIEIAPDSRGQFHPDSFLQAVDSNTLLVSTMFINNEVGIRLPVMDIGKAVKRKNPETLFHVDAVQGFLKYPIRLRNSPVDLMSISGHKIGAPKGVGALFVRQGVRLTPLFHGGGQQDGLRPGTDSVPLISGFGAAVREQRGQMQQRLEQYGELRQRLLHQLAGIPEIHLNSTPDCVPYIINLSVEKIRSEIMLHFLEQSGIYVSSGSACSGGAKSYVLKALGFPAQRIDTALRISFGTETTADHIDILVEKLREGIETLIKLK